ncbi:MAG: anti-sigma factor family protein [Planctomycetota bacterium]
MNCEHAQEMLADYLGQELDPADQRAFGGHLASCDRCRTEVESLQETLQALRQLPPAPAGVLPDGVRSPRATQAWPGPRYRGLARPLAYAATLLIGIGIGWLARPAGTVPGPRAPDTREVHPRPPWRGQLPDELAPSPFVRNALAFSAALNEPSRR